MIQGLYLYQQTLFPFSIYHNLTKGMTDDHTHWSGPQVRTGSYIGHIFTGNGNLGDHLKVVPTQEAYIRQEELGIWRGLNESIAFSNVPGQG